MGAPDFPRRPLADKFLYRALVRVNAYKCAKFQLPSSTSFRYKEGILKFNVGATTPTGQKVGVQKNVFARSACNIVPPLSKPWRRPCLPSLVDVRFRVRQLAYPVYRMTERMNE